MGPREREEGAFGEELQPVLKKLRLGEGEKKEVEGEGGELEKGGERRGYERSSKQQKICLVKLHFAVVSTKNRSDY